MTQIRSLLSWNILVRRTGNKQVNCLKSGSLETGHNGDLHGRTDALRKVTVTVRGVREASLVERS